MDKDIIKNINNLPSISQTIKEYNLFAKKKLSQNFILDLNLTNKIINLSDRIKYNSIIEIGPGPGSLTRSLLLNGAKKVIAIEKDKRFIDVLQILKIASHNKLIIENEDALNINLKDSLDKFLQTGERKFGLWLKNNNALKVDFSDQPDIFINLNSPQDFADAD